MGKRSAAADTAPMKRPHARRAAHGFTLIEQLAVVVGIGATSAVALPQLAGLRAQTDSAVLAGLAGAAGSGMVLNQAACLVTDQRAAEGRCTAVSDCADAARLLMADLPAGYRIEAQAIAPQGGRANGVIASCRMVQVDSGASAPFTGLSAAQ